ncbi:MAG TPA: MBL fold metallo-hydrolase [Acidimicrobiales bacterium]|nr:MBL fold metallo-hydrolase [Acidimicrobiales bacterium]
MALSALPRIERLHLADLVLPQGHPAARDGGQAVVFGFVIDHPEGAIVVDTGVGQDNAFIDQAYAPTVRDLSDALSGVGVDPGSVVAVVNSHLHFDHCGQNPTYYGGGIPVFVQAEEVEAAKERFYTVPEWAAVPAAQLRALRGDESIAEGVTILSTPGHTRGHQSVLVEGGGQRVVLGAQAVWDIDEFDREKASPANVDAEDLREAAVFSIRRLKALDPDLAYFSHHPGVFRRNR